MEFAMEFCITNYTAESSAINSTRTNGFNSLLCLETFDLKPSKQYTHVISVKESNQS